MAEKKRKPGRPPGSKNKNTKKKPATAKAKSSVKNDKSSRLKDEIAAIIMLAIGVFFAIAMHTELAGQVGIIISHFLKGMFGHGGYILPYFLILYSMLIFFKANRPVRTRTIILIMIIFLFMDLINAERFITSLTPDGSTISEVYDNGVLLNNGGLFGMYVGALFKKLVGSTGIYIISIVGILVSLLLIVNTPMSAAYDKAKAKKAEKEKRKEAILAEKEKNQVEMQFDSKTNEVNYIDSLNPSGNVIYTKESKKKKKSILNLLTNDPNYGLEKPDKVDKLEQSFEKAKKEKFGLDNIDSIDNIKVVDGTLATTGLMDEKVKTKDVIKAKKDLEDEISEINNSKSTNYIMPPLSLLSVPKKKNVGRSSNNDLLESAKMLEDTLKSFNVSANVINVTKGSSVTRYEIQPSVGVKVSSIVRLADDIALNLRARSIRIEAPIPGKAAVGIEVENENREMVSISEIISSKEFIDQESKLVFAVGKDIGGKPIVSDLGKMPHLLIAGATGSGKSVCINTIIASILYKASPDEVKMVLIDPKMVELGNYNGIPHLLIPVVTDPTKAAAALNWAVAEMTNRYKKFAKSGVRGIKGYNALMKKKGETAEILPKIVVVIDELADLMMVASNQVEDSICRIAQLARAAGMHLIVATQRPSVDVITGLIKANIPSRIAFMVSSQIDSRTIIDMPGAEKLVGNGDMLFKPQDLNKPLRVQGPFISDNEVRDLIDFVKEQNEEEVVYNTEILDHIEKNPNSKSNEDNDELLDDAIECVVNAGQASVSMLQRRFRIGYNRAARIIDIMESRGIVGPQDGSRPRSVNLNMTNNDDLSNDE
ncbi:MAG: DNA translocase FtsK 4TM domain-containing protein [Anaerovoracaceae bacterium]